MRNVEFAIDEYYHIYNRGVRKHSIFEDSYDRCRFLFLLFHAQASIPLLNVGRHTKEFERRGYLNTRESSIHKITKNRVVELTTFILMDNHFHLIVKEVKEGGISKYMQKILNGYTKYSNAKYKESGHLFQGSFKAVHIATNEQLLHVSAYIHRNIRDDTKWKDKEHNYPWSSFKDYTSDNRWGDLIKREIILGQFKNPQEYFEFTV
ncbi:MAG TPA: transposase [Candidatus Paceibacterota bacterium]